MNNLNSVLIEGNLVRDPDLVYQPNGSPVTNLYIISNRFYKANDEYQKETSLFDIKVYGRQAEVCHEYLEKGRGIRIVGRLKQQKWQEEDGTDREKVYIVAEHVEFKPKQEIQPDVDQDETESITDSAQDHDGNIPA